MLELYVTETERNTGKIVFSAGLAGTMQALGYYTSLYKPVQTGAVKQKNGILKSTDLDFVKLIDDYMETYSTYIFEKDGIPALSAKSAGVEIDTDLIKQDYLNFFRNYECVITDGTNGLSTPLSKKIIEADLIKELKLPFVLVAPVEENSINNTIMAINQAQELNSDFRGVILSTSTGLTTEESATIRLVKEYSGVSILGIFNKLTEETEINPNDVIANIVTDVNIEDLFNIKIAKLHNN